MSRRELSTCQSQNEHVRAKVRGAALSSKQCGLVTRAQLRTLRIASGTVARWIGAGTESELEEDFLYLCQRFNVPLPQVNTRLHGEEPDCYWPEVGLVVELDGDGNHGSPAQRNRDQRKALKLRANGLTVVRYTYDQVNREAATVAADALQQIEQLRRLTYPG